LTLIDCVVAPLLHCQLLPLLAVSVTLPPAQKLVGPLALIVATGSAFTVTIVVPVADVHPLTVAVTLYVPEAAVVALAIVGFCKVEVKPLGPVQA
jgi:hypothetical protein